MLGLMYPGHEQQANFFTFDYRIINDADCQILVGTCK